MTVENIIKLAEKHAKEGENELALEFFSKAIQVLPTSADLYSQRGVILFHLKRSQESLDDMNKAVELQPDYSYRYSSRAYIKSVLGLVKDAILDYEKAIELDPEDTVAYNNLGLMQEKLGWEKMAKKNFKKADELDDILKANGISAQPENYNEEKEDLPKKANKTPEPIVTKGDVIKNVFTKKNTFKEFINFVKSGFKIKE